MGEMNKKNLSLIKARSLIMGVAAKTARDGLGFSVSVGIIDKGDFTETDIEMLAYMTGVLSAQNKIKLCKHQPWPEDGPIGWFFQYVPKETERHLFTKLSEL